MSSPLLSLFRKPYRFSETWSTVFRNLVDGRGNLVGLSEIPSSYIHTFFTHPNSLQTKEPSQNQPSCVGKVVFLFPLAADFFSRWVQSPDSSRNLNPTSLGFSSERTCVALLFCCFAGVVLWACVDCFGPLHTPKEIPDRQWPVEQPATNSDLAT